MKNLSHYLSEMRVIGFIDDFLIIKKILEHLGLWKDKQSRAPPSMEKSFIDLCYEPIDDGWSQPGNIFFTKNRSNINLPNFNTSVIDK